MKFKVLLLFCLISNSVLAQNLNTYFTKAHVEGSISIYDLKTDTWRHSNNQLANKGTLPASTFKIIHTLIGLKENIISGKHDTIRWNGEPKLFKSIKVPSWNKDNDLEMAFKNSTIWYYEEISKQIKKWKYRKHLKRNEYSDRKIMEGKGHDFWNFGQLKVTPIEQIKLLIKLYHNELFFKAEHQELAKELMIEQQTSSFVLRSKTGWCYDGKDIGWYVGYIELEDNAIFFATRIEKGVEQELKGFSKLRKSITKEILGELYSLTF